MPSTSGLSRPRIISGKLSDYGKGKEAIVLGESEQNSRQRKLETRELAVVIPRDETGAESGDARLADVLDCALAGKRARLLYTTEEFQSYLKKERKAGEGRVLFVLPLGEYGVNLDSVRLLRFLRDNKNVLEGFTGGVIADSRSDLYTKSAARELVFTANMAGCSFVGRPLVEGTRTLSNFAIVARNMGTDLQGAYRESAAILTEQIITEDFCARRKPRLLVLHASSHRKSNTYALWREVRNRLEGFEIKEIGLRNGTLSDCSGCPYKMCLHFGEKESCFYGGVMVEDVYPAVRQADGIIMLCPNYNDAISANLTAFINRLTALFRTTRFYDKALFAIVVSGYSGSDLVAGQLIAALNMNKTFYLPGKFAMLETANDPGAAMALPGIAERIDSFARRIQKTLQLSGKEVY